MHPQYETIKLLKKLRDNNDISQYHYCLIIEQLRRDRKKVIQG